MEHFFHHYWDNFEAMCPECKSVQPTVCGYVTTHLAGPACKTCGTNYGWEDGRPMLVFPSNMGKVFKRMKDVYEERPKKEIPMRKLFRFKYEPCNRTCYAYCSKLMTELRKLDPNDRESLVSGMVMAHNRLCDNPDFSFGVDVDEENEIFVSHFRTPQSTDLYSSKDFAGCVRSVCKTVLMTDIPKGSGECTFGDNGAEDLGREILKFCTDVGYAEVMEKHCECDSMALTGNVPPAFREALIAALKG